MTTIEAAARRLLIRTAVDRVPLCGCGSTGEMWRMVRDVLRRIADNRGPGEHVSCYDPMPNSDPERVLPGLAVEFVAQVLSCRGLTEHGSSVAWGWLTQGGKVLLAFLDKYGCDSGSMEYEQSGEGWPNWSVSSDPEKEEHSLDDAEWRKLGETHADDAAVEVP